MLKSLKAIRSNGKIAVLSVFFSVHSGSPFLTHHYRVLGLQKHTPYSQVKKKYYELAKIYHPDVNTEKGAHEKFSEITKSYEIITENRHRQSGDEETASSASDSIFNNKKYRRSDSSSDFDGRSQKRKKSAFEESQEWEEFSASYNEYYKSNRKFMRPKKGEDIFINTTITLKQSLQGVKKTVEFTRKQHCPKCIEKVPEVCFTCGGKGEIFHRTKKQKVSCRNCQGRGFKIGCEQCHDSRFISTDVKEEIFIEKGTQDKNILRIKRNGHQGYKDSNGDLYVTVLVEKAEGFQVEGNNVRSEEEIDFLTAVFGGEVQIETLHGIKQVQVPAGMQSGQEIRLFNWGLKSNYSKRQGDHILKVKIRVPSNLSQKQRYLLNKLSLMEQLA